MELQAGERYTLKGEDSFVRVVSGRVEAYAVSRDSENFRQIFLAEVKAGQASLGDFKHLKWFAANLAKGQFTGVVLYSGTNTLRFGEGFYAVPLAALGA